MTLFDSDWHFDGDDETSYAFATAESNLFDEVHAIHPFARASVSATSSTAHLFDHLSSPSGFEWSVDVPEYADSYDSPTSANSDSQTSQCFTESDDERDISSPYECTTIINTSTLSINPSAIESIESSELQDVSLFAGSAVPFNMPDTFDTLHALSSSIDAPMTANTHNIHTTSSFPTSETATMPTFAQTSPRNPNRKRTVIAMIDDVDHAEHDIDTEWLPSKQCALEASDVLAVSTSITTRANAKSGLNVQSIASPKVLSTIGWSVTMHRATESEFAMQELRAEFDTLRTTVLNTYKSRADISSTSSTQANTLRDAAPDVFLPRMDGAIALGSSYTMGTKTHLRIVGRRNRKVQVHEHQMPLALTGTRAHGKRAVDAQCPKQIQFVDQSAMFNARKVETASSITSSPVPKVPTHPIPSMHDYAKVQCAWNPQGIAHVQLPTSILTSIAQWSPEVDRARKLPGILNTDALKFLDANGYVIVRGLFDAHAITQFELELVFALHHIYGVHVHEIASWMHLYESLAQITASTRLNVWHTHTFNELRQHPALVALFAQLYGTTHLTPSVEHCGTSAPCRTERESKARAHANANLSLYTDANFWTDRALATTLYEGMVCLEDADESFVCLPGLHHPKAVAAYKQQMDRLVFAPQGTAPPKGPCRMQYKFAAVADPETRAAEGTKAANAHANKRMVALRKGDYLLWHQHLPHAFPANRKMCDEVAATQALHALAAKVLAAKTPSDSSATESTASSADATSEISDAPKTSANVNVNASASTLFDQFESAVSPKRKRKLAQNIVIAFLEAAKMWHFTAFLSFAPLNGRCVPTATAEYYTLYRTEAHAAVRTHRRPTLHFMQLPLASRVPREDEFHKRGTAPVWTPLGQHLFKV